MRRLVLILAAFAALTAARGAAASTCFALASGVPGVRYADLGPVATAFGEVAITFVGHATYTIESPEGVIIATDYTGRHGERLPTAVTMNKAHSTHYTNNPDPGIQFVFRGWNPAGDGPARHSQQVGDVLVRNVTTDIRRWDGERETDGNSIFVFEVAELCIGHLGHLHHTLGEAQLAMLGRLDVVMVPVDGSYTLRTEEMVALMERLKTRIVLPMHYFGPRSLELFLEGVRDQFAIERPASDTIRIAADRLPSRPTVQVVQARYPDRWLD